MRKPSVRLVFKGRVAADLRHVMRSACRNLRASSVVQHDVDVWVVHAPAVTVSGGYGFGCYVAREGKRPLILVAGRIPRTWGMTKAERREFVLSTFAHELCHYVQHRDGRPMNHRGIEAATKRMMRVLTKREESK